MLYTNATSTAPRPVPVDSIAQWSTSLVRYFLVDQATGNDNNVGYVDAASGSTISPTGLPKATIAGLLSILPKAGSGRDIYILIANSSFTTSGTTYAEDLDLSTLTGYHNFWLRGSTDLTNSATDQVTQGARIGVAGPNGDSSWTVAAGATTLAFTVSAGTLTAEADAGGLTGMRVRRVSDGAFIGTIWRNSSTVVEFGQGSAITLALNDTVWIERPGVLVTSYHEPALVSHTVGGTATALAGLRRPSASGIGTTSTTAKTFTVNRSTVFNYSFCEVPSSTAACLFSMGATQQIFFQDRFINEGETARSVGGNRVSSVYQVGAGTVFVRRAALFCTRSSASNFLSGYSIFVEFGNYFRGCIMNSGAGIQPGSSIGTLIGNSTSASFPNVRIQGRTLRVLGNSVSIRGIEFENVTTGDCLEVGSASTGLDQGDVTIDRVVNGPAAGNTGAGINLSACFRGKTYRCGNLEANTVSGTVGEIRIAGSTATGVITTHTGLTFTNVIDKNGTNIVGSAGSRVSQCQLVTNKEGSTLSVGHVVKSNGTTKEVEFAQADSEANSRPVGAMVTPPANNAEGYKANSGDVYILFPGTVTPNVLTYLDPATAGQATVTVPVVNSTDRKQRLGRVVETSSGAGYVAWAPGDFSELADGVELTGVTTQEIADANSTFSLSQKTVVYTSISATRSATLPALSTVRVGDKYILKDRTGTAAQTINLTPAGADLLEGVNAPIALATGTNLSFTVEKTPTSGWIMV